MNVCSLTTAERCDCHLQISSNFQGSSRAGMVLSTKNFRKKSGSEFFGVSQRPEWGKGMGEWWGKWLRTIV